MKKTITLTVAEKEFSFDINTNDYNDFINGVTESNKVQPSFVLLNRTIDAEQKEDLKKLIEDHPNATAQMAGMLIQEFAPAIEISVKK